MKLKLVANLALTLTLALLPSCGGEDSSSPEETSSASSPLTYATADFQQGTISSNPGNLAWYYHVPPGMTSDVAHPLVVALHGCTQSASSFKDSTGWNTIADKYHFYMVYPEQSSSNNSMTCFNWGGDSNTDTSNMDPAGLLRKDVTYTWKGHSPQTNAGDESASIVNMVAQMKASYNVDRVFVTGLSAGAYMTAVMLAVYPDVFSAGAIMEGGPYLCNSTLYSDSGVNSFYLTSNKAYSCMSSSQNLTAAQWAALVQSYTNYQKPANVPWPRVQIWEGTSDTTVYPVNADELISQWTTVHGLTQSQSTTLGSYKRTIYPDPGTGQSMVEEILVDGMAHAVAIDPNGSGPDGIACGATGSYVTDKQVCSPYYAAQFFGITGTSTSNPDAGIPNNPVDAGTAGPDASSIATIDAGACAEWNADNISQVMAGRAHLCYTNFANACALGSEDDLGAYSATVQSWVYQVSLFYYKAGRCSSVASTPDASVIEPDAAIPTEPDAAIQIEPDAGDITQADAGIAAEPDAAVATEADAAAETAPDAGTQIEPEPDASTPVAKPDAGFVLVRPDAGHLVKTDAGSKADPSDSFLGCGTHGSLSPVALLALVCLIVRRRRGQSAHR